MNCPKCNAPVQSYDRFCIRCGHDMQPTGATERQQTTSTYNPSPYVSPTTPSASAGQPQYARTEPQESTGPTPQTPFGNTTQGQSTPNNGDRWASGSSTPGPNPFANTPSSFSNGTMLNGRPANSGKNGGLLQGLGAGIVALFVVLGKFGGLVAGVGLFKLLFYWWLFSGLLHAGLGTLVLVVVVVLIVGGIARSRGMV